MPTSASTFDKPRRVSWDAVRVVAVVSVVLGHITHQGPLAHLELNNYPFKITAQFGAAALMVISGYFVCQTVRRGGTRRWLWKKIARLVPPYLVAVVVTYLIMRISGAVFNGQSFGGGLGHLLFGSTSDGRAWVSSWYVPVGWDLLVNLLMIQGWHDGFIWLDGSYWTLPVQLLIFSGAALLWSRTRWFRTGRVDLRIQALAWAMILGPLVLRFFILGVHNPSPWAYAVINGFGLHRLHAFAAGIGIWLWTHDRMRTQRLVPLLAAAVLAQDLHLYPEHVALPTDPARVPSDIGFAVLLLAICAAAKGPDWTFLRPLAPLISWLAGISYGVYLVHQELGYILARVLLDAGFTGWERLPIVLAAAIAAGWLLAVAVERPAHRWLTRRRKPTLPSARLPPDDMLPARTGPAPISVSGPS